MYSDKFAIYVLSLSQILLATDNDKLWDIDHWVRLFKARTWEELKMLANQKPDFIALSEEMFKQHADETIRQQCRAREDYEARERGMKRLALENEALSSEIKALKKLLSDHNIPIPDDMAR